MKKLRWPAAALLLFIGAANIPVSIRQGVDYRVQEIRMPLWVKASEFLARDFWYRRIASEVTAGEKDPETKLRKAYAWSKAAVRPQPSGWPVMDDHIHYTIVRGYGVDEQQADVFTTIASYSGVPAFWGVVRGEKNRKVLTFCFLDGAWRVWDSKKGSPLRDKQGAFVTVEQLSRQPGMAPLAGFFVPEFTRAEKQMPLPRLGFEAKKTWLRLAGKEKARNFDPEVVFSR